MDFGRPQWLWGLLLIPVIAVWAGARVRSQRAELTRFAGTRLADALAPGYSWRKHLLKGALEVLAVALIIFALAVPRFGSQLVKVEREGIDIVIALDTSLSMLAEDMLPSRLERAKHEIVDLIKGLSGDRVGLVVFAGDAFALCPLTVDYEAALMFTRSVDVYFVSEPGTAIDRAIRTSVALFDESSERDRAVILVTDGENHEGTPLEAAAEAAEKGIRVYTIGIGSPRGELIPERGTAGENEGYKKDKRGETVLTKLDELTLQEIASKTKAKYLPATTEGLELKVLYSEIAGMDRQLIKGEFVERRKERFYLFLAAAFALLVLDAVVGARATGMTRRRRGRMLHTGVGAFLLGAIVLLPGAAGAKRVDAGKVKAGNEYFSAQEFDKARTLYMEALGDTLKPRKHQEGVYYNMGNSLVMQQRYQQAIDRYQRSFSEDSTLTGSMLYNRGNALLMSGNFKAAVESYVQALAQLPDDEAARHNLEMALRMIEQQQQQEKDQQQQGDDGEKQDQQDQQKGDGEQQQDQQQQGDQKQQDQQQQQEKEGEEEQQDQPAPADSTQMQPPPDSSAVAPPQLSPEDMMKLSKEDALRILQALEEQEKKLQKERRKAAFRRLKRGGKDW